MTVVMGNNGVSHMIRSIRLAALTASLLTAVSGVHAQDAAASAAPAETPFVAFTGSAAFVTDYRFRGVSLSDRDIAGQASITATFSPGFFVGIWGSSIEPIGAYTKSNGTISQSKQEIDLSGGYSKTFGSITPTIGAIGYVYPGGRGVDYVEVYGTVAGAIGPATVTIGTNYAPSQDNTTESNLYIYGLAA